MPSPHLSPPGRHHLPNASWATWPDHPVECRTAVPWSASATPVRMALSNYLAQTILGLTTLGWLLQHVDLSRTLIAVWILGVWALQLWWSTWWLQRFRYGPFEWVWRCSTYRSWQPLRRSGATG